MSIFYRVLLAVITLLPYYLLSQSTDINPKLFSKDAFAEEYVGIVTAVTVSDGYIIRGLRRTNFDVDFDYRRDNDYFLMKIKTDGLVDRVINVHGEHPYTWGSLTNIRVLSDTVAISYIDSEFADTPLGGDPGIMRYDKDLNLLDRISFRDTAYGPTLEGWSIGASSMINLNSAVHLIKGGYEGNSDTNTSVYGQKFSSNGEFISKPLYGSFPIGFNSISVGDDRLLLTGSTAFTVLDTNLNVIINGRVLANDNKPPYVNAGLGGFNPKGIAIGKSYYYIIGAANTNLKVDCLTAMKWNDYGDLVDQKLIAKSYSHNSIEPDFQSARSMPTDLYDGDSTIYSLTWRFGEYRTDSIVDLKWYITAIDTNLNTLWVKSIVAGQSLLPHTITFSPDSTQLLIVGKDGAIRTDTPSGLNSYLLNTADGSVSNVSPLVYVTETAFLRPSLASTEVYVDLPVDGEPVSRLQLFSLGDGRQYDRAIGPNGTASVRDLAPGAYVAYGYRADGTEPALRQKIVVVR